MDKRENFQVTGMTCAACSATVERAVKAVPGVKGVAVNLLTGKMAVDCESATARESVAAAVKKAGYDVAGEGASPKESAVDAARAEARALTRRLITSVCLLLPLMYISMGHMLGLPLPDFLHGAGNEMTFALTQFFLTLGVVVVNRVFFKRGFQALMRLRPNMDSLIAIGAGASLLYGVVALYAIGAALGHGDAAGAAAWSMDLYFESAAMILTLITLGKTLEARSKGKTSEALTKLMDLAPQVATVVRDGAETTIPVEQLRVGDIVAVRPGQSLPADGVVVRGEAAIDQSALTGESMPVDVKPGDAVSAATINRTGYITFRAEKVGEDTALSQVIRLVDEAASSKAPISRLADKISAVFVPTVMAIALLTFVYWLWTGQSLSFALTMGVSVLVISCPCALGLATPVAIMTGTGRGASLGILFKSAEALERSRGINVAVLDKTGTVTEGVPKATDVLPADGVTEERLLTIAASLEKPSEHPLAEAVLSRAGERGLAPLPIADFRAEAGRGIRATVEGAPCAAGNAAFMAELGVELGAARASAENLAREGKTILFFARERTLLGLIAAADVVKPTSAAAVRELKEMGVEVVLLTGDNRLAAEAIRTQLEIGRVVSEVRPDDKEAEVRALQEAGKVVAMVGDGINDAPALTRANVGIAIGAGTDIAIESADVVLMKSDPRDVATAIRLGRAVLKNIRENLFWAFFYNVIGIPIAAGLLYPALGLRLNPMIASAAMSLSSVCVVLNALRLKRFQAGGKGAAPEAVDEHARVGAPDVVDERARVDASDVVDEHTRVGASDVVDGRACADAADVVDEHARVDASDVVDGRACVDVSCVVDGHARDDASDVVDERACVDVVDEHARVGASDVVDERTCADVSCVVDGHARDDVSNVVDERARVDASEAKADYVLHIEGMMCAHCVAHVGEALRALPGVEAEVDLEKKIARVHAPKTTATERMRAAVAEAGYEVTEVEGGGA